MGELRSKQGDLPVSMIWESVHYPCLSALPFLERLTSSYCLSKEVLQLRKITNSLVLSQE